MYFPKSLVGCHSVLQALWLFYERYKSKYKHMIKSVSKVITFKSEPVKGKPQFFVEFTIGANMRPFVTNESKVDNENTLEEVKAFLSFKVQAIEEVQKTVTNMMTTELQEPVTEANTDKNIMAIWATIRGWQSGTDANAESMAKKAHYRFLQDHPEENVTDLDVIPLELLNIIRSSYTVTANLD